uniref:Uncharacterized protein n=1 Tax=Clytia hemisphaerica TaxID=252671 RepID=A0A7M5XBV8_9CNID
ISSQPEMKQVIAVMFLTLSIIATSLILQSNAHGLSYNYYDEIAQSYCASRYKQPAFIFAIRRDCAGVGPPCIEICKKATPEAIKTINYQQKNLACFDALSINKKHNHLAIDTTSRQPDAGRVAMTTYGYGMGGCVWKANHCGPNYCCCRAY